MGLGFCIENAVTGSTSGCSALMEAYMVSLISPHALMLLGAAAFNAIAMLISCCMFWKRKEPDVFPEFRAPKVPVCIRTYNLELFTYSYDYIYHSVIICMRMYWSGIILSHQRVY